MFNERLKQLRIENNLTQQALAELTDLTKASISRFESNKKDSIQGVYNETSKSITCNYGLFIRTFR
ncbi:helix-turn-helix domain-containing protein [Bacillus paranthracis]